MAQSLEQHFEAKLRQEIKDRVEEPLNQSGNQLTSSEIKTIASICLAEALEEQIADWGNDAKRDQYVQDIKVALKDFNVDNAFEKGGWNILFRSLTKRLAGFSKNARDTINQVPDADQCKITLGYNDTKSDLTPFNANSTNMSLQSSELVVRQDLGKIFGNSNADTTYKQTNPLHEGKCYICDKFLYAGSGLPPVSLVEAKANAAILGGSTVMECEHILAFMTGIILYGVYNVKKADFTEEEQRHFQNEYFWSHRCCNQKKTDIPLVTFNSNISPAQYIVNPENVTEMINAITSGGGTDLDVECALLIPQGEKAAAVTRIMDLGSIAGKKLYALRDFANEKLKERVVALNRNNTLDVPRDIYAAAKLLDSCGEQVLKQAFQTNAARAELAARSDEAEQVLKGFNDICKELNATIQAYMQSQVKRTNIFGRPKRGTQVVNEVQKAKNKAIAKYQRILKDTIGKGEDFKVCEYKNLAQVDTAIKEMAQATTNIADQILRFPLEGGKKMNGGGPEEQEDQQFLIQKLREAIAKFGQLLTPLSAIIAAGPMKIPPPRQLEAEQFIKISHHKLLTSLIQKIQQKLSGDRLNNILALIRLSVKSGASVHDMGISHPFGAAVPPVAEFAAPAVAKMEDIDDDFGIVPDLDGLAGQSSTGAFAGDGYQVVPDIGAFAGHTGAFAGHTGAFAGHTGYAEQRQPVMHSAFGASAVGHTGAFAGHTGHAEQRQPVMDGKYGAFGASAVGHAGRKEEDITLDDLYKEFFGGVKKKKTRRKKGRTTRKKRKSINKKRKSSRKKRKSSRKKRKSSRKKN